MIVTFRFTGFIQERHAVLPETTPYAGGVTIEDAGTRPRIEAKALAVPARAVNGVVQSAPTGLAAVQTEQLIGDIGDALRLLDAVERVRGHAHPLIIGLQDAVG